MPQPQLVAGGIGVLAAGAAEHGLHVVAHEDVEEWEAEHPVEAAERRRFVEGVLSKSR